MVMSPSFSSSMIVDLFRVQELAVLVTQIAAASMETGHLLSQAGAERVGAGDDDAVVDAELEERVAARR